MNFTAGIMSSRLVFAMNRAGVELTHIGRNTWATKREIMNVPKSKYSNALSPFETYEITEDMVIELAQRYREAVSKKILGLFTVNAGKTTLEDDIKIIPRIKLEKLVEKGPQTIDFHEGADSLRIIFCDKKIVKKITKLTGKEYFWIGNYFLKSGKNLWVNNEGLRFVQKQNEITSLENPQAFLDFHYENAVPVTDNIVDRIAAKHGKIN